MSGLNFSGLASGIDSSAIIKQMVRFNQTRIDRLKLKQVDAADRQKTFKDIQTKVLSLDLAIRKLARPLTGPFDVRKATSSDETILKAAANGSASAGNYSLRVLSTAKANIVGSQGFAAVGSQINTGTITIGAGSGSATITINNTNNSLQGLAAAINAAKVGVQASIVKDGSGATPYRLLLTSEKTGEENAVTVTNSLGDDDLTPTFTRTIQAASDAEIQIGSGAGAITVSNASNTFTDAIPGVTVSLQNADAAKDVTITVANDPAGAKQGIKEFVDGFNSLMDMIDEQTKVDPTRSANDQTTLSGNRRLIELQAQIRSSALSASSALPSNINRLSALGIKLNRSGRLEFDEGKLDGLMAGNVAGTSFADVKRAFAISGESSNPGVTFVFGSSKTKESATPYQVNVTQAATQATLSAATELGESTVIDGTNNTLQITISGQKSSTISLAHGTYTRDELANEIQAKLSADSKVENSKVSVSIVGNKLTFTTATYGRSSTLGSLGGTAVTSGVLGLTGTQSGIGQDVAGSYVVNGKTETATGSGQVLIGAKANANTADMRVLVNLTSGQLVAGNEAEIKVTQGVAGRLQSVFESIVDPASGRLKTISDALTKDADQIKTSISREEKAMQTRQESLLKQFAALEDSIGKSKSNGDALTNALSSLFANKK